MKATLPKADHISNGLNYGSEKETTYTFVVVAHHKGDLKEVLACRCYMGRSRNAETVYASIWTFGPKWLSGTGKAGGWGYCKTSAAINEAIRSAGIKLDKGIHGAGIERAMEAMTAIARALGFRKTIVVRG